jgi:hypothetical protein
LASATTVAAGTRAATMLMAVAVVAVVAVALAADRAAPGAVRGRRALAVAVVGLGAPLVVFGWFYVRIWLHYGDLGASQFLMARFDRETRGGVLSMFTQGNLWLRILRRLTSPSTFRIMPMPGTALLAAMGLGGFLVALRTGRTADTGADGRRGTVDRRVVGLLLVASAVVAFTVAQHLSGGGMTHARYLFPALAPLAIVLAVGYDQLRPRVAPALLLGALAWWSVATIPTAVDREEEERIRPARVPGGHVLEQLPGSTAWRLLFAVLVLVGLSVSCAAVVQGIRRPRPRAARGAPSPQPASAT